MEKCTFAVGDKIELHRLRACEPIHPPKTGTIFSIDGIGTLHVLWDDGEYYGIVPGEDDFNIIKR